MMKRPRKRADAHGTGQQWRGEPNTGSLASGRNHAAQTDGVWNDAELTGTDAELGRKPIYNAARLFFNVLTHGATQLVCGAQRAVAASKNASH